ncbi:MAG TPA: hypothetical protein VKV05_10410 [Terriglobales bacterium]|nr:hypothetical protein [Terriglobales bacterium]
MTIRKCLLGATILSLAFSAASAQGQWVIAARAAAGQIERMTNKSKDGSGYDVATVVLAANADQVYQTALSSLKANHPEITIKSSSAKKREIKFSRGDQIASMKATPLGEKLTQLVVASNLTTTQPSATSMVVSGVMKVCKEMNVVCTLSEE